MIFELYCFFGFAIKVAWIILCVTLLYFQFEFTSICSTLRVSNH